MQRDIKVKNFYYILKLSRTILVMKKIMAEMGLNFYLKNGTLLGLLRDGFPIPGDDVDLFSFDELPDSRFDEFTEVVKKHGLLMYHIEAKNLRKIRVVGVYIRGDNIIATGIEFWAKEESGKNFVTYDGGLLCPKEFFEGEKRQIDFLGEKFDIPTDSEGFLEYNFGKNWKTRGIVCIIDGKRLWVKCDINKDIILPIEIINEVQPFDKGTVFKILPSVSSSSSSYSSSSSNSY